MITIGLFFSTKGFFGDVQGLFKAHCEKERASLAPGQAPESYTLVEHAIRFDDSARERANSVDVIISRGFTLEFLKNRVPGTPIVGIHDSGHDLIRVLARAKSEYATRKAAIIGPESQLRGVQEIADILGVKITVYLRRKPGDQEAIIREALAEGCDVIIGGVDSTTSSQTMGLPTIPLHSGKEALWQAFTEAKNIARVSLQERAKAGSFRAIIDHTPDGILEIDTRKKVILSNAAADKLLGGGETVLGKDLRKIISDPASRRLFEELGKHRSQVIRHRDKLFALNTIPITINRRHTSTVITVQDTESVQKTEFSIRKAIAEQGFVAKYSFSDIIGASPAIRKAKTMAMKFAEAGYDILLAGDSGTGKELFAQSIHNHGPRRKGPFVAVNCAAIQPQLLESILFGYSKGAFTGASKEGRAGLFEEAHRGTIFLDEIAEISPELQSKLLRVIQEREVMRLGDNKIIPVDMTVISATNKNLLDRMARGLFREDLFYRLDVLTIKLPTLDERPQDIPLLADFLIRSYARKHARGDMRLTPDARELLCRTPWPGNVRQLGNICARAVVLTEKQDIDVADLKPLISTLSRPGAAAPEKPAEAPAAIPPGGTPIPVREALEKTRYNRTEAAKLLGISRTTLWKILRATS